jgi:HEAT repeat protein
MTSLEPEVRQQAYDELFDWLCHQCTPTEVAPAATPFLLELLEADSPADKANVIELLALLIDCNPNITLQAEVDVLRTFVASSPEIPSFMREELVDSGARSLEWSRRAHKIARQGVERFIKLLHDEDANVRVRTAYLLSRFSTPANAARIAPHLVGRVREDPHEGLRGHALKCLTKLQRGVDESTFKQLVRGSFQEDPSLFVQWIAARIVLVEGMSDLEGPATKLLQRVHDAPEEIEPLNVDFSAGL